MIIKVCNGNVIGKGLNFIVMLQIEVKRYVYYFKRLMVKILFEKNVVFV